FVFGARVPLWSYLVSYAAAIGGAFAYFARDWPSFAAIVPEAHKYDQLLVICVAVLVIGGTAVAFGARRQSLTAGE
ncbi:MAG: sodium:proline symporter, partial [Pseudomonadota bacterium]